MARKNNFSGYYRRGGYKKRKWRIIIAVVLVSLVVLTSLFLIIGNILNQKTNESDGTSKSSTQNTLNNTESDIKIKYTVKAYNIDLTGLSLGQFSEKLSALSENGVNVISLKLTDDNGYPLYSSDIVKNFGYGSYSESMLSLSTVFSKIDAYGMIATCYVNITSNMQENAKTRTILAAYEAAIISEISEAGSKDIILCPSALSTDDSAELTDLSKSIKNINSNTIIGIAIPSEMLKSQQNELFANDLTKAFDFIAIDLTKINGEDFIERTDGEISENLYYILRYNARVLLPYNDDISVQDELLKILEQNGINNWQFIS